MGTVPELNPTVPTGILLPIDFQKNYHDGNNTLNNQKNPLGPDNEDNETVTPEDITPEEITENTQGSAPVTPEPLESPQAVDSDPVDTQGHIPGDSPSEALTEGSTAVSEEDRSRSRTISLVIYGILAILVVIAVVFTLFFSTSSRVDHVASPESNRDGLLWETPPETMSSSWSVDGYSGLINTPGAIIGVTNTGVERIDSQTGDVTWSYDRPDSSLCHAIEAGGNIAVLFNSGQGCSDIMTLDSATGERIDYAMYGIEDNEQVARLVHGQEHIAIVTPEHVRFLSMSLTPTAEFGARPDMLYPDDQEFFQCEISDVAIGPDHGVVASRCDDQTSYHVNAVDLDPEESTMGALELSVDTKSSEPVTIPMVSLAQVLFLTSGDNPTLYAWQLDKSKAEISATPLKQGMFPRGYWDISRIGYTWLLGEQINVRYGSEDISQSLQRDGVIGNPMVAEDDLLLPKRDGIEVWNTTEDQSRFIDIDGFGGTDFAFAGETIVTFDRNDSNGTVNAYTPGNQE